jgi:hypothetical protein
MGVIRDGVQGGREALEAAMQGVVAGRPPVGSDACDGFLALAEGLNYCQPVPRHQGLLTPPDARRHLHASLSG